MLTDTLIPGTTAAAARTVLRLADDWDLPALAAERVSWAKWLTSGFHSAALPRRV